MSRAKTAGRALHASWLDRNAEAGVENMAGQRFELGFAMEGPESLQGSDLIVGWELE